MRYPFLHDFFQYLAQTAKNTDRPIIFHIHIIIFLEKCFTSAIFKTFGNVPVLKDINDMTDFIFNYFFATF